MADQFKRKVPVILNLQTTDHELSKRLIDFASGLTYALDGGMQRIAEKVFPLTPRNVRFRRKRRPADRQGLLQPVLTGSRDPRWADHRGISIFFAAWFVGFIGSGNMAAAMARLGERRRRFPVGDALHGLRFGRATALAKEVGGRAVESNEELVRESDFVILAVKPAALELVAEKPPAPRAVLLLGATPLEKLVGHFPTVP